MGAWPPGGRLWGPSLQKETAGMCICWSLSAAQNAAALPRLCYLTICTPPAHPPRSTGLIIYFVVAKFVMGI